MRFPGTTRGGVTGWAALVLARTTAHRLVVVAAGLTVLVAAMLGSTLAALAGRALPIAEHHDLAAQGGTALAISGTVNASDDAYYTATLPGQIRATLDGTPFTFWHAAWSDPLGFTTGNLAPRKTEGSPPLALAAALGDIAAHAVLVSGSWPTAPSGEVIPAALPVTAAALMHVATGDVLRFKDQDSGSFVRFRITGLYRPVQMSGPAGQYWQLDLIGISGVGLVNGATTFGPLTVQPPAFGATLNQSQASWVALPQIAQMRGGQFSPIAANVEQLTAQIGAPTTRSSLTVSTSLPSVLSALAANLDVARSLLAICAILLALLAGAALLAAARLLYGQREGETAMLAARGATRGQLLRLTAAEAIPICVIAAVGGAAAGIWLARALTDIGPVPSAIPDALLAAALVAAGTLVIMLAPALSRVMPGTARVRRGRQPIVATATRAGLDLALIALAVLACWQLRHYSAVSAGASGTYGVDPVVVLAPALALAGGTVAALRLLPAGGKAGERLAARGRRLVGALASWQISRQPIRQGGAALLIVLAVATATLALTQRASWIRSVNDQAAFQVGADVQVQTVAPLTPAQEAALVATPGIRHAMPVAVFPGGAGSGQVVAIGTAEAPGVTLLRPDQSPLPATALFAKIRAKTQRPGAALPGHPVQIQLTAQLGPSSLGLLPATVQMWVQDANGVSYVLAPGKLAADGRPHALTFAFSSAQAGSAAASYPLRVTALSVAYTMPGTEPKVQATFTVDNVSGGPGTAALPGSALRSFVSTTASPDLTGAEQGNGIAGKDQQPGTTVAVPAGNALTVTFGSGYGLAVSGVPNPPTDPVDAKLTLNAPPASPHPLIPGIATQGFLTANSTSLGSIIVSAVGGAQVDVKIVAVVPSFPTVTSGDALVVDLANVENFLTSSYVAPAGVTRWWLATTQHAVLPGLAAGLPGGSTVLREPALATQMLADPLSGLPQQALLGVAIAALLLASLGFCVSIAAGVRQRRAENALLAALGLAPRAAAGQLCLEKFMLSLPSAVTGLAIGAFLAELLVPAITLSPAATAPVPPVLIEFGWAATLGAALALAVLPVLAAALVMVRRPDPAAGLRASEAM
jgi:hypothetical protein